MAVYRPHRVNDPRQHRQRGPNRDNPELAETPAVLWVNEWYSVALDEYFGAIGTPYRLETNCG